MATIDINSLTKLSSVTLSDVFETYTLSGDNYVSQLISFSDISAYFFNVDSFAQLSAKYDELLKLFSNFKKFLNENYPKTSDIPKILTTAAYLSNVINELMTIKKVEREYLNEYCTYDYAEFKKNSAYDYHEKTALAIGSAHRKTSLNSIVGQDLPEEEEE